MVVGEPTVDRGVDNSSPTSTVSAPSRPRPPQWKSFDDEVSPRQRSSALSDTDLRLEGPRGSADSVGELQQADPADVSPPWPPPSPHPPAQSIGLPTIREGLRLVDQKSEISEEEEDDSSSAKTTLYIDIDPASPGSYAHLVHRPFF
ncbi:hypothetical protein BIW11_04923 [Tropilaelaps mercedesae]|uniref:Uncharacterized protein n=1 Tax=Tropilaelaps mercedesae TaxID=418985 RepID=A0A1V9WZN1_9ACAR|nr:hypothetical protein BIW11_04923 [Tropilaelaps mercedesae]